MSRYIFNLPWKVGHILFFPLTDYFFFEGLTPTLHLDAKMALVPGLGLCSLSNMSQEQTQVLLLCPSVLSSPTVPSVPWGQEPSPEVGECAFCRPKSLLLTFFHWPSFLIHILGQNLQNSHFCTNKWSAQVVLQGLTWHWCICACII